MARVHAAWARVRRAEVVGLVDGTLSYARLLLAFDLTRTTPSAAETEVERALAPPEGAHAQGPGEEGPGAEGPGTEGPGADEAASAPPTAVLGTGLGRELTLPVCFEAPHAPDLDDVARAVGLAREEVVALLTATPFTVAFLGFSPGFPYLLGLPPRLRVPRLASPRRVVPAGSLGLAGAQAGLYPSPTPGGWRLVGATPERLFDARRTPAGRLAPGDRLRLRPIDAAAYAASHAASHAAAHAPSGAAPATPREGRSA